MALNVAILLFEDAEALDFAGPYEVFTTASRVARRRGASEDRFTVFSVAQHAEPVRVRAGLQIVPDHIFFQHPAIDVLIIPGGVVDAEMENSKLLEWIQTSAAPAKITASVCTGAFLLAAAGVLTSGPATTHWEDIADLREQFPALQVQESVRWVDQGRLVTSAGISAGIDMSLHLVARLAGQELAVATARQMEFDWAPR